MPSLGWQDPIWQQLYGKSQTSQATAALAPDGNTHYLDQLQAAAAAGQQLNLSDMAGFQTNLRTPQPGDEDF